MVNIQVAYSYLDFARHTVVRCDASKAVLRLRHHKGNIPIQAIAIYLIPYMQ